MGTGHVLIYYISNGQLADTGGRNGLKLEVELQFHLLRFRQFDAI